MSGFAKARVDRLLREAGAHRVSADAISRLNEILSNKGTEYAKRAVEIAKHSGRKTVQEADIRLAASV